MIELNYIQPAKTQRNTVLFSKNGQIRFKVNSVEKWNWKDVKYIKVGFDKNFNDKTTSCLYFAVGDESNGFKLSYQNKSYFISGKTILEEMGLSGKKGFRGVAETIDIEDEKFIKVTIDHKYISEA